MRELDGGLQVGVTQDDVGTLAAQLEGDPLHVVGGRLLHDLSDFGRSGESNLRFKWKNHYNLLVILRKYWLKTNSKSRVDTQESIRRISFFI